MQIVRLATTRYVIGIVLFTSLSLISLSGCQTSSNGELADAQEPLPPAPAITSEMPLDQALQAAINYGGDTMADVRKLVKRRKEGPAAAALISTAVAENILKYRHNQLINAMQLYTILPTQHTEMVFDQLISSGRPLARQLGWQLASTRPSRAIAASMERELSRALQESDEDSILLPQMASALQANNMKGSYTYARQGLMLKGNEAFARAMIALDPLRASEDLMTYLGQAPGEELRQLTLASVDPYTCITALRHLKAHPVTLAHPDVGNLFYFAVSRNTALADLAQDVIEGYLPHNTDMLAVMLSRLPVWTQIAFLEDARRKSTPKLGLLLGELRKVSSQADVLDELREVR